LNKRTKVFLIMIKEWWIVAAMGSKGRFLEEIKKVRN